MSYTAEFIRYLWMPGSDIFTRRRMALEYHWMNGPRDVLDAGFGNGWFAYRAHQTGARVLAVSNQAALVAKARRLYNDFLNVPEKELRFDNMDLYDVSRINRSFHEIVCYETLEHIEDDRAVCISFYRLLRPGGALHLCCPNADHPRWRGEELDANESGGHVRPGYTLQSYEELLEPIGFNIVAHAKIGGPVLVFIQESIQAKLRPLLGEAGSFAACLVSYPLIKMDPDDHKTPFSIYVKAVKRPVDKGAV